MKRDGADEFNWFAVAIAASVALHSLGIMFLLPSTVSRQDPALVIRSMTFIHKDAVDPIRTPTPHFTTPPMIVPERLLRSHPDSESITVTATLRADDPKPVPVDNKKLTFDDRIKKRPGGRANQSPLFQELIRQRISRSCEKYVPEKATPGRRGRIVVLAVTILPSGKLESVEVIESSNHPVFDRATVKAVRMAAPFPSFPEGLNLPRLKLRVPIKFVSKRSDI